MSLQPVSYDRPTDLQSSGFTADVLKVGAFSARIDQQMLNNIQKLVNEATDQIIDARKKIDQAIEAWYEKSKENNASLSAMANQYRALLETGSTVQCTEFKNRLDYLQIINKDEGQAYANTAAQLMQFQKLNSDGKFDAYKGTITLIFFARMEELKLYSERAAKLREQENHELSIMVSIHAEQMKEEEAVFDRALKQAQFDSDEDQRSFNNRITEREQARKEQNDIRTAEISKLKIRTESELERIKAQNQKELDQSRIDAEKIVQMRKLNVKERTKFIDTLANVVKPSCNLM